MLEYIITSVIGLLSLTAIGVLLIVTSYREYRLRKKVELLQYMIDNSYETDKVDIDSL